MKVVAVLGISGVGKSTLVEKAGERRKLLHLKASDLIKARLSQTSEQLRQGAVLDNQALMLAEFGDRIASADNNLVVFDGHSLIDTPNGLLEIHLSVFEAIRPSALVFIEEAPAVIAARRNADAERVRPGRTPEELAQHQALAKERTAYFALSLGLPMHILGSNDIARLLAIFD